MSYTLYVAQDRKHPSRLDVGSVLCMQMIETLDVVQVQHVRKEGPHPTWLVGTPTLFDDASGEIWRGHQAVTHLHDLALAKAASSVAASARNAGAPPRAAPPLQASAPASAPASAAAPAQDADPLWESVVPEGGYDDDDDAQADGPESLSKKLTSDDFARAMQARTHTLPRQPSESQNNKRPPPSMSD